MAVLLEKVGLEFDDVLLLPNISQVNSRGDVDISVKFSENFSLDIPIIASPMRGIVGWELIEALGKLGGIGILHRFFDAPVTRVRSVNYLESKEIPYGVAIGIDDFAFLEALLENTSENLKIICVDVANGYTEELLKAVKRVSDRILSMGKNTMLMSGNVVTNVGVTSLVDSGADMVRVGIGSGALCTTRNKTGVGKPQMSTLLDLQEPSAFIVSDGGIRNSGDIVKALGAGAHAVMIGSLLATTFESSNNGVIYGMASKQLQEQFYTDVKSIEGVSKRVNRTQPLEELIRDITWNIKSACTYVGAKNLFELRQKAVFTRTGYGSILDK